MRIAKRYRRHLDRAKGALTQIQKTLALGKCHPSWGQKRAAAIEKFIEQKEKKIEKKRLSKSRS
jgi:hypothetical protein